MGRPIGFSPAGGPGGTSIDQATNRADGSAASQRDISIITMRSSQPIIDTMSISSVRSRLGNTILEAVIGFYGFFGWILIFAAAVLTESSRLIWGSIAIWAVSMLATLWMMAGRTSTIVNPRRHR